MYELIISTRNGIRHSVAVSDWNEANAELARFERDYIRNHANDMIVDASVLDGKGDRVARYNNGKAEIFN